MDFFMIRVQCNNKFMFYCILFIIVDVVVLINKFS